MGFPLPTVTYIAENLSGLKIFHSLVAVMIQAIAHRVNYLWVIEDDCSLVGIVTFSNMLKVFREHLETI